MTEDSTFDTVKKHPFTWDEKLKKDKDETVSEVDRFYQNLLNKISNEGRDPFTCINCGKTHKDAMEVYIHNAKTGHVAKEAVDIPISLPVGPSSPDYDSEKLPNSPEDNVFVPDDIDEDDQYITNINKYIFNDNDALEPISPPGQQKRYTEEADNTYDSNWACPRCGSKNINNIPTEYGMRRECNNCGLGKKGTEANDHMNEDEHNNTMNNDNTNEDLGEFPNTEPEAESTLDKDTAPLSEEANSYGDCPEGGQCDANVAYDESESEGGTRHCSKCGKMTRMGGEPVSSEANDPDMSAGLFNDTDPDNNANDIGFTDANTTEEDTDVVSDTPLSEEAQGTLCGDCNGEGYNDRGEKCSNCDGTGKVGSHEAEGDKYELDSKTGDYVPEDEDPDSPKFASKNKKTYKDNTKDKFNSFGKPKDEGKEVVEWNNLGGKKVIDKGNHFETEDGETIIWSSYDAARAQHYLQQKSKESLESFFNLGKKKVSVERDLKCNTCGISIDQHDNPNHHIEGRIPTDHYYNGTDDSDDNPYGFEPKNLDYFNRPPRKSKEVGHNDTYSYNPNCPYCAEHQEHTIKQHIGEAGTKCRVTGCPNEAGKGFTGYCDEHKKQLDTSGFSDEADQSIDTDNPQDLLDIDKTVGKDFDHKESYSSEAEYSHLCPKCHRTWHCMTQKNYGSCDEPYDSLCYDCKGENWVSPDEWTKSKEPVPQFIYDQVTRIGKDENSTEAWTIKRWYAPSTGKDIKVIKRGLTEEEARAWTNDPSTRKEGEYFDVMVQESYSSETDVPVDDEGYYKPEPNENFTCLQCKKDFGNNFKAFFQHSRTAHVNGESFASEVSIEDFRRIVNNFQAEKIKFEDGKDTVDVQTANAIVTLYDGLTNQPGVDEVKRQAGLAKLDRMIQRRSGVITIANKMFGG